MTNTLSDEVLERAKICNSKQYHITNAFQPKYVVLALNPSNYHVVFASDNSQQIFDTPKNIIGKNFLELLEESSGKRLAHLLAQENIQSIDYQERLPAQITIAASHFATEALFFRNKEYICVEIETSDFNAINTDYLDLLFLRLAGSIDSYYGDSSGISSLICKSIHKIIGFDRVWYCEFDDEGSGFVSGEYNNGVLASLMHHRFPSTDVPNNIRAVYAKNKYRAILDSHAKPSVFTDGTAQDVPVLDLTYSLARNPASSHLEYLNNMGVRSSASFSVVRNGKLSALFGAHSSSVSLVKHRQLAACQYLVDKYVVKYELLHSREEYQAISEKEQKIELLIQQLQERGFDMGAFIKHQPEVLHELLDADGCLYYNGKNIMGDIALDEPGQRRLMTIISNSIKCDVVFCTQSLSAIDPYFSGLKSDICGILALSLLTEDDSDSNEILIWYRKEHPYNEKWAGNPAQAVLQDASGKVGPRQSFNSWVKSIEGHSTLWKSSEIAVAGKLRYTYALRRALYDAKIQKQAAEKANAYKSQFLANMSHELRTPLHTMIGFVESIMEKIDSMPKEKQLQYLTLVHNSSERLLLLINDLLDLAKLEAGMMSFTFAQHDFRKVIENSLKEVSNLIETKRLNVSVQAGDEINLAFDKVRMTQVMVNLLSNAAKFTADGKNIDINVSLDQRSMRVEVSDQGIGIPDDELSAVFDKFVQSSKTRTDAGGTGLGLSICKEIMQAHQGRIWAENNIMGGASFFIYIPFDIKETAKDHPNR